MRKAITFAQSLDATVIGVQVPVGPVQLYMEGAPIDVLKKLNAHEHDQLTAMTVVPGIAKAPKSVLTMIDALWMPRVETKGWNTDKISELYNIVGLSNVVVDAADELIGVTTGTPLMAQVANSSDNIRTFFLVLALLVQMDGMNACAEVVALLQSAGRMNSAFSISRQTMPLLNAISGLVTSFANALTVSGIGAALVVICSRGAPGQLVGGDPYIAWRSRLINTVIKTDDSDQFIMRIATYRQFILSSLLETITHQFTISSDIVPAVGAIVADRDKFVSLLENSGYKPESELESSGLTFSSGLATILPIDNIDLALKLAGVPVNKQTKIAFDPELVDYPSQCGLFSSAGQMIADSLGTYRDPSINPNYTWFGLDDAWMQVFTQLVAIDGNVTCIKGQCKWAQSLDQFNRKPRFQEECLCHKRYAFVTSLKVRCMSRYSTGISWWPYKEDVGNYRESRVYMHTDTSSTAYDEYWLTALSELLTGPSLNSVPVQFVAVGFAKAGFVVKLGQLASIDRELKANYTITLGRVVQGSSESDWLLVRDDMYRGYSKVSEHCGEMTVLEKGSTNTDDWEVYILTTRVPQGVLFEGCLVIEHHEHRFSLGRATPKYQKLAADTEAPCNNECSCILINGKILELSEIGRGKLLLYGQVGIVRVDGNSLLRTATACLLVQFGNVIVQTHVPIQCLTNRIALDGYESVYIIDDAITNSN
jgi:hypothetical protein